MDYPCFIDVEASGLHPDSWPIEIAWSDRDGGVVCYRVRPAHDWTHWDYNAERLHGIERQECEEHGVPAERIARALNAQADANGGVYFSDAPGFDEMWLTRLFDEAQVAPRFSLHPVSEVLPKFAAGVDEGMERVARTVAGRAHRADHDVRFLLALYRLHQGESPWPGGERYKEVFEALGKEWHTARGAEDGKEDA